MKKLLIIVLLILSCAPKIRYIPPTLSLTGIDFTSYTNKGFLITPNEYLGDYEAIGIIRITATAEAECKKRKYMKGSREYSAWHWDIKNQM